MVTTGIAAGIAAAAGAPVVASESNDAVVNLRAGQLRGRTVEGVLSFKGIPYAAPPVGPARFLPPQAPVAWSGVRDALDYGPKPPQADYPPIVAPLIPPELTRAADDCLTLNV